MISYKSTVYIQLRSETPILRLVLKLQILARECWGHSRVGCGGIFPSGRQRTHLAARLKALPPSEYAFLLGRFIDSATLARAEAIPTASGVHPHEVLIAHGWLDPTDYYRALAEACGAPFKADLLAAEVAPPAIANPRQSLAIGLLKERARARRFVLAPDRVRPNALREMLARLAPHEFSLASPDGVRGAICRHFAPSFVLHAVEGLASRKPEQSARTPLVLWQRLVFSLVPLVVLTALALNLAVVQHPWFLALGLLALRRRGDARLLPQIPLMPSYWLFNSAAAYRALWQFATARFEWQKTEHGLANGGASAPARTD